MNVEAIAGKVLIDTNVLIYATLRNDPRHARAREVLTLRRKESVDAFVAVQNLAEMYPNLTGPKNQPPDAPEMAQAKIRSIANLDHLTILPITAEVVHRALGLCAQHNLVHRRYFDMQLAALMLLEGIATVITENPRDFTGIAGLRAINPFAPTAASG